MPQYDIDRLRQLSIRLIISHETGKEFIRRGTTYFINCPLHEDPGPSLSINEDENTWYCHGACGVGGDGIRFIELLKNFDFQDACKYLSETHDSHAISETTDKGYPDKGNGKGRKQLPIIPIPEGALTEALPRTLKGEWWAEKYGKSVAAWRYHDVDGGVVYIDVRFEKEVDGVIKKQVVPLYWGRKGRWKMGIPLDIIKKQRILYNLHMLAGNPGRAVLVVEGCKCASVSSKGLRERFILTTWPGGTNGLSKVDIRPLYGRKVIIWPDDDPASKQWERGGYKAAYYLAEKLSEKADVTILRAVENPDFSKTKSGYDIVDFIADGGDPLDYINNEKNIISLDDTRAIAGLMAPLKDDMPDFRDIRKFTTLGEPTAETILNVSGGFKRNEKHSIMKSDGNFLHLVEGDPAFRYLVAYDTATNQLQHSEKYKELDEIDNSLWQYCQRYYEIAPTKTQRSDMVKSIAYRNSYNSLQVFIEELKQELYGDNEPKFETNPLNEILSHFRFAIEDEYTDAVMIKKYYSELFHKYFMRMFIKLEYIIRGEIDMIPPGDIVPILEGDQGIGKTRFCLLLSIEPPKYYVDMSDLQLTTSRDTVAKIRGKLIGELGELAGLKRTELEAIKAFISGTFDEMRRLYSESTVRSPRTISFIGTTNEREYLRDTTGNRRFWPVRIDYMDHDLFSKKELIKKLYVFYRYEALKSITGDKVQSDLLISPGLFEFTQYLREEKRVKPVFIDSILHYIQQQENNLHDEPVKINVKLAAAKIFETLESKLVTLPPRFQPEFNRILDERGYKQKRGTMEGQQRRYWQLDGRYCNRCKRVVEYVIGLSSDKTDGREERVCEECLKNIETHVEDPF